MTAPHILFVDDAADTCASMSDVLTDFGYGVDVAYDGPTALQLIERNSYRLALLDYRMPGMDGLELHRRIQQLRPEVVGVFVTAFAAGDTVDTAREAGVRRVLSKPVDFDQLMSLLEEIIGRPA